MRSAAMIIVKLYEKFFTSELHIHQTTMKKFDPYNTPTLGRVRPKRHFFHSLLKRHRSDTGLVEDRTSSVTIVRIIVGLLMLHLVIIGGVLLRGHMVKDGTVTAAAPVNVTSPTQSAPEAAPTPQPVLTPPAVLAPTSPSTVTAPALTPVANHITQPAEMEEDVAEEVAEDVTIAQAATSAPVYHMVATGDTWQNIAAQYAVSPAALQAANPTMTSSEPAVGVTIVVPTGRAAARGAEVAPALRTTARSEVARPASAMNQQKIHTVQRGETLSRISRKVKVPVKELMQLNGLKDANRISPGMKLRLSR